MKVLIATEKPFAPKAVQGIRKELEKVNYELVLLEKYTEREELLKAVADVDALIIRSDKIDREVIQSAKNLKIVVRAGAGYDNVDLEAATEAGVCVMNTPGQNSNAVAELIIGMLLYTLRSRFNGTSGTELKGKRLGIQGYGNIGKNIARLAKGFQMSVMASHYMATKKRFKLNDGTIVTKSLKYLYGHSDIVSINVPLIEATRGVVNKKLLERLPEDGIVVNTARKEVINEEELLEHMIENPKFRFITDIKPDNASLFEEKCPNQYFSTPKKMGAQTAEANINAGIAAATQIIDYLENGNERFKVNK